MYMAAPRGWTKTPVRSPDPCSYSGAVLMATLGGGTAAPYGAPSNSYVWYRSLGAPGATGGSVHTGGAGSQSANVGLGSGRNVGAGGIARSNTSANFNLHVNRSQDNIDRIAASAGEEREYYPHELVFSFRTTREKYIPMELRGEIVRTLSDLNRLLYLNRHRPEYQNGQWIAHNWKMRGVIYNRGLPWNPREYAANKIALLAVAYESSVMCIDYWKACEKPLELPDQHLYLVLKRMGVNEGREALKRGQPYFPGSGGYPALPCHATKTIRTIDEEDGDGGGASHGRKSRGVVAFSSSSTADIDLGLGARGRIRGGVILRDSDLELQAQAAGINRERTAMLARDRAVERLVGKRPREMPPAPWEPDPVVPAADAAAGPDTCWQWVPWHSPGNAPPRNMYVDEAAGDIGACIYVGCSSNFFYAAADYTRENAIAVTFPRDEPVNFKKVFELEPKLLINFRI